MRLLATILAGAMALAFTGGCDTGKTGGDKTAKSDKKKKAGKKGGKKGKKKAANKGKGLKGKKVAASNVANKGKLGDGAEDDSTGFGPKMRGAIADGEATLEAKMVDDPALEGDVTGEGLAAFGSDFKGAFGKADEKVEPPKSGVIGAPSNDATMVWRYVEPMSKPNEVAIDVGRVVMVGGSQWQTTLLAVDARSGNVLAAAQPVLKLNAAGDVSETKASHRFRFPLSQIASQSGEVVFAMASSQGDGVHNALGVASANVSGGKLQGDLKVDNIGYLSGRQYVRRGKTAEGEQVVTQLHFVMYLAESGCLALQVHELSAAPGTQPQKIRLGGCAKIAGGNLTYQVNVMCNVQGNQEQCKKLAARPMTHPFQLFGDGLKWNGSYLVVPLDGDKPSQPKPDEPQPQPDERKPETPQPDEPQPDQPDQPKPKDPKQKSYSDREVKGAK